MRVGLHLRDFGSVSPPELADHLNAVAVLADDLDFSHLALPDHVFQVSSVGSDTDPMLESYATLGFLAARTRSVALLTLVTAVTMRRPQQLMHAVHTLDILSGGRAMLGVGAAWNGAEHRGLGLDFPVIGERYRLLEEALRMHCDVTSRRPDGSRIPLLVGGEGEQRTLALVAKYAQACNMFSTPKLAHKLAVLQEHCRTNNRCYDDIEKTVYVVFDPGRRGERIDAILAELRALAELGVDTVIGAVVGDRPTHAIRVVGEHVIPAVRHLRRRDG